MLKDDMDFGEVQVMAISIAFAKKMMGFPVRIWAHSRPNCRQKDKRHDKIPVTFFTGKRNFLRLH